MATIRRVRRGRDFFAQNIDAISTMNMCKINNIHMSNCTFENNIFDNFANYDNYNLLKILYISSINNIKSIINNDLNELNIDNVDINHIDCSNLNILMINNINNIVNICDYNIRYGFTFNDDMVYCNFISK